PIRRATRRCRRSCTSQFPTAPARVARAVARAAQVARVVARAARAAAPATAWRAGGRGRQALRGAPPFSFSVSFWSSVAKNAATNAGRRSLPPVIAPLLVAAASTGALPHARAQRVAEPPRIDGRLDDSAWQTAPVLDGFVQRMPDEGKPASERTEVHIVYDDRAIYVGFRCWDSHASEIRPRLATSDNLPNSDWVAFAVDPAHDRRSAYIFVVNSAGVLMDGINTEGQGDNYDWDGVWDAQTSIDHEGWSAEIRIPLSTLRFRAGGTQTWGFHVRRFVARLNEQDDWNLIGINDASFVGRFADL